MVRNNEQHGQEGTNSTVRTTSGVRRRSFLKTATASAGLAAFAGCLGDDEEVIQLGAMYIFSGFASLYGDEAEQGFDMAKQEINENGGIDGQEVEIIPRDTEADADTAVRQITSLIEEDDVDGLFGLDSSGVAQALAPTIAELEMPFIVTHAATPFLTSPVGEHENSVGNEWVFRNASNLTHDMFGAAQIAADLDLDQWMTIGPDYAFGYETWDYFRAFAEGMGVDAEFIGAQFPPLAESDYTPYINAVLGEEPDGVVTPLWGTDLTTFLGQAEDAGWFEAVDHTLFSVGMGTDLPAEGSPLPEGEFASARYDAFVPDIPANNDFRQRYVDEYDTLPTYNAEGAYRAVYLYKDAIEQAGSADPGTLRDTFSGMDHSGAPGEYRFDEGTNQATLPAVWGTVSYDEDYESNVLEDTTVAGADPEEVRDALAHSELPPGV